MIRLPNQAIPLFRKLIIDYGITAAAVYGVVWRKCKENPSGRCVLSNARIADAVGLGKRAVMLHLRVLRDHGYLVRQSNPVKYLRASNDLDHCSECGIEYPALEVHHIKPQEKGGTNAAKNLTYLCPNCHSLVHLKATCYVLGKDLGSD